MPGFIVNGKQIKIDGLNIINYLDDPSVRLKIGNDGKPRTETNWVRGITFHTTGGPVTKEYINNQDNYILEGHAESSSIAERIIHYWTTSPSNGGAHIIIDHDCKILCTADLQKEVAYHATSVNWCTIGIEMVRGSKDGIMYMDQLLTGVAVADALTRIFRIQRQFNKPYRAYKPVKRLTTAAPVRAGANFVGCFGHRDQTDGRGPLDPGDPIFQLLEEAGYEGFDFAKEEDIIWWKDRQRFIGLDESEIDGIPGPKTVAALESVGYSYGLWIQGRPGD